MLITRCGSTGEDRAIPEGRHMGRRGGEQLLIGNLQLASLLDTILSSWPVGVSATVACLAHELFQTQDRGEKPKG